ncbi:monosaccharide ABC transporter membrane protein, CUT2 family [Rhizobiales bacterium GAS191]|jgi:rhamnose transport system permease protein|nr:monosaccharide ABC transporter membrane protein, CUT2 family [Rhizobiales bacterium GAS113]SEE24376.1 monosaccharide ABC transporter membrane protein, CUT2 family [Rhizobiales bacterium GAS191]SEE32087.1 monosaccharide ABC transporter membrane protein, CUT2 family [Rhizobiales bacterium GAS188]
MTVQPHPGIEPDAAPAEPGARYQVADRAPRGVADLVLRWETILLVLLAAVIVGNTLVSPYFLDLYNLADATYNFSEKAIIALAMALLILIREIDLSVAATLALAALCIGFAAANGYGAPVLIVTGLAVGLICGAFNGLLVTRTRVPSIVVTIGTMSLFRGIAQVSLGDQAYTSFPPDYLNLGQSYFIAMPPTPLSFLIFLVLAIGYGIVLHGTATGRRLFAIGANPLAARFTGIRVDRIRFALFTLAGLMAGLAAVLLTARIGVVRPNIALGWELDIVTMVVLGGVAISGGVGTVFGVVLAVFVLGLATFGLSLTNVPGIVINVLLGLLLIVSIAAPIAIRGFVNRARAARPERAP